MKRKFLLIPLLLTGLTSTGYSQESNPSVGPLSRGDSGTFTAGTDDRVDGQQMAQERRGMRRMSMEDRALVRDIRDQIASDRSLSMRAKSISISSEGGRVILRGAVATSAEKEKLEEIARKAMGTRSVENRTEVETF